MTPAEFAGRRAAQVEGYARNLVESRGMTPDRARAAAAGDLDRLLPDGVDSAGALVFTAKVDGGVVGWIWLGLGNDGDPAHAWIYNVEVDEPFRGRGYGRAVIEAAEAELAGRGVTRLGLNVFGTNTVARRLYESMGFTVDAVQMSKPVRPV